MPIESLLSKVESAIKGGVTLVQLREKNTDGKEFFEKAKKLKELLRRYQIPLIINDRIDIALAVEADGVHIGQKDLPVEAVRKIVPENMIVGVSAKTVEEAKQAEQMGADYLGVGAVFPTNSKKDAEVLAEGMLRKITQSVSIPAVAIGGIHEGNIVKLTDQGIDGVAVVSAILSAENGYQSTKQLHQYCRFFK